MARPGTLFTALLSATGALRALWSRSDRRAGRFTAILGALIIGALLAPTLAPAAELVVFERRGCVYCQRFDAEVAPIYEKTDEAKSAPLRRVDLGAGVPADLALSTPVRFTPTFVLVDKGREIGRITGYISDDMFWGLLTPMTAKLSETH